MIKNYVKLRQNYKMEYNMKSLSRCKKTKKLIKIDEGKNAEIFMIQNKTCGTIVIKKNNNAKKTEREAKVLLLTNELIEKNICPGYNYAYSFDIENNRLYLEYIDTNIRNYINNNVNMQVFHSILFQTLYSIMCLFYIAKRGHCDLHCSNVFIKNVNPKTWLHYKLNNVDYYIPIYGYLCVIGDFGSAYKCNSRNYDFHDFIISLQRAILRKTFTLTTKQELYAIISKKLLDSRNISNIFITENARDNIRNINKILVANIDLFDYTKWLPKHDSDIMSILINVKKYNNIITAIHDLYSKTYATKPANDQICYDLQEIHIL